MGTLPVTRVRVWLKGEDPAGSDAVEHEARILHIDRIAAERQLLTMGIKTTDDAVMGMSTAWAWAALHRTKSYDGPLAAFLNVDCLGMEDVEDEGDTDPTATPPPTGSGSGSPSPSPEPPSSSG